MTRGKSRQSIKEHLYKQVILTEKGKKKKEAKKERIIYPGGGVKKRLQSGHPEMNLNQGIQDSSTERNFKACFWKANMVQTVIIPT